MKSKCGDTCILYACLPENTILKNYAIVHGCLDAVFTFPNDIRKRRTFNNFTLLTSFCGHQSFTATTLKMSAMDCGSRGGSSHG